MRNGSLLSRTAALLLLLAGCWSAWTLVESPMLASVAAVSGTVAATGRVKGQHRNAEARTELEIAWGDAQSAQGAAALLSREGATT